MFLLQCNATQLPSDVRSVMFISIEKQDGGKGLPGEVIATLSKEGMQCYIPCSRQIKCVFYSKVCYLFVKSIVNVQQYRVNLQIYILLFVLYYDCPYNSSCDALNNISRCLNRVYSGIRICLVRKTYTLTVYVIVI